MSAPTTRAARAPPASTWARASERPERKPVQAAPMSIAPAPLAPTRAATCGAAWGWSSSGVKVATSTRSISEGSTRASSSARAPARAESSTRLSPLTRRRRSTPVREAIQSESIPSGAAISSFSTTRSGSAVAIEAIPAELVRRPLLRRGSSEAAVEEPAICRVSRATSPSGSTSEASTSKSCSQGSSGNGPLPARDGLYLCALDRPTNEAGEDLARPDVEEATHAELPEPSRDGRPADRAGQGGGQGVPRVLVEEVRGHGRDHGRRGAAELDLVERRAEGTGARLHRGSVEGARDREALRANARGLGSGESGLDAQLWSGEHELLRRVLVGDDQAVLVGERLGARPIRPDGEHAAGLRSPGRVLHRPPARDDDPQPGPVVERTRGRQGADLAE